MFRLARLLAFGIGVLACALAAPDSAIAGTTIEDAQRALIERGFDPGGVDGKLGPRTRNAIRSFQASEGLPQTGDLDTATLEHLLSVDAAAVPLESNKTPAADSAIPSVPITPVSPTQTAPTTRTAIPVSTLTASDVKPSPTGGGWNRPLLVLAVVVVTLWGFRRWLAARRARALARDAVRRSAGQSAHSLSGAVSAASRPAKALGPSETPVTEWHPITPTQTDHRNSPPVQTRWHRRGEAATVGSLVLADGMVYVGRSLSAPRTGGNDNCLIDPSLPVAKTNPDRAGDSMPYWPSYSQITPQARLAYLSWLASGRSDPSIGIGHVFIFFYGLERRLFLDKSSDDAPAVIAEVERLLSIYGDHRSFVRYARSFLDVAYLLFDPVARLERPPPELRPGGEMPLSIRAGIGRLLYEGKPVPADWMLAWYLSRPDSQLRTPAKRAFIEFTQLFRIRFAVAFPEGLKIAPPRQRIKHEYQAASGTFTATITGSLSQWPDVIDLIKPLSPIREIVESCTATLEPYSRLLGKEPAARGTLEAISLLPTEIANMAESQPLEELRQWLASTVIDQAAAVDADELFERLGVASEDGQRRPRSAYIAACELLGRLNFGVEPDPRFGAQVPKPEEPAVVFRATGGAVIDPARGSYGPTLALLGLGALLVHGDGEVTHAEERHLLAHLESIFDLNEGERLRLRANLLLLMRRAPKLAAVRKRLEGLQPEMRRSVARFAIAVAGADGRITPEEVRLLERVYGMLDLDRKTLFSDIHALGGPADEPTTVRPADIESIGVKIPAPPPTQPIGGIMLNPERLKRIREDTARVSGLLSEIFIEEQGSVSEVPQASDEANGSPFNGLDARHGAVLKILVERRSMPRSEFESLVRQHDLLPDGALGTINDWAVERFGDIAVEEGETVTVVADLVYEEETRAS